MGAEDVTGADSAPATDNPGGLGERAPKHQFGLTAAKSARLERKALTKGFPIRDEFLGPIVNRQIAVAMDPDAGKENKPTVRDQTRAFLAVIAARRQNLEIEAVERGEILPPAPPPGAAPLPPGQLTIVRRQVLTEVIATYDFTQPGADPGAPNGHADDHAGQNGTVVEQRPVAHNEASRAPGPHANGAGPRPA
jgi:hypothetical protein